MTTGRFGRRRVLAGAGASLVSAQGVRAASPASTLMVAGPVGGRLDRWADLLAGPIGRGLPRRTPMDVQNVGGLDGVTGANQFEAQGEPDGSSTLLIPGTAITAWLVGDGRAKFDPGRWIPVWAVTRSCVLVSRSPLLRGRAIRLGAAGPAGPELPFLLALDAMGLDVKVVGSNAPDAVMVQGAGLHAGLLEAARSDMEPVLTLGEPSPEGGLGRDPQLPGVLTVLEAAQGMLGGDQAAALRAVALAVQLEAALVLPKLTPAGAVATWRSACAVLAQDNNVLTEASRVTGRLVPPAGLPAYTSQMAGDAGMLLGLRRWLATRFDWQPA